MTVVMWCCHECVLLFVVDLLFCMYCLTCAGQLCGPLRVLRLLHVLRLSHLSMTQHI